MTETASDVWLIESGPDGTVVIDCGEESPSGAARLEFEDGSFVEVDPVEPSRLLRVCAASGQTGDWLLRTSTGAELTAAVRQLEPGSSVTTVARSAPDELATLGRAALVDHLAIHDARQRRALWRAELLSVLGELTSVEDTWTFSSAPLGPSADDAAAALADAVRPDDELDTEVLGRLRHVCEAARRSCEAIGARDAAQRFGSVSVDIGVRLQRDLDTVADMEAQFDGFDLDDWEDLDDVLTGSGLGPVPRFRGRVRVPERTLGAPDVTVEAQCDIDVAYVPERLSVRNGATVIAAVTGGRCSVSINHVDLDGDGPIYLRIFDPAPTGDLPTKLRHLAPAHYDPVTKILTANVPLTAASALDLSGPLLADFVDSPDTTTFPTRFEYWANVTRSSMARLILALIEQSRYGPAAVQAHRERIARAAGRADASYPAAVEADRLKAESEPFLGSLAFITPVLMPGLL